MKILIDKKIIQIFIINENKYPKNDLRVFYPLITVITTQK